jgi:hypothetical protein
MKFIITKVDNPMRYLLFLVFGLFLVNVITIFLYYQLDIIESLITWYDMPLSHDQKISTSIFSGVVLAGIILYFFRGRLHE